MNSTRRKFIANGAGALGATALIGNVPSKSVTQQLSNIVSPRDDSIYKPLLEAALDAAKEAGASYADVRLVHTRNRRISILTVGDNEGITVGIRSLVDGYWGFAAGPAVQDADSMRRLGRESVFQAKQNTLGQVRQVLLADRPIVQNGSWTMPVKIDPFVDVHPDEVRDYLKSLEVFTGAISGVVSMLNGVFTCTFNTQLRIYASTDGSYCTQKVYSTSGTVLFAVAFSDGKGGGGTVESLTPAGLGWELFRDQDLRAQIEQIVEESKRDSTLPVRPIDVGRYDTILHSSIMAKLTSETLGIPTQLDRIMGFEANAGGTSYLNDPLKVAGTFEIATSKLNVTANRSEPGSVATVKWDDEGCSPQDFKIIKNGVVNDFQTTRESAGWVSEYYRKSGQEVRSNGCAYSPEGIDSPLAHNANLVLQPGAEDQDFESMISLMENGIAFRAINPNVSIDFQGLSGLAIGIRVYEIKKGKRTSFLTNSGLMFRALELWKNLKSIGGVRSSQRYGLSTSKGEPSQRSFGSVTAPSVLIGDATIIDYKRKA